MDIYLEAERVDVGKYRSAVVPRVGDRIALYMDRTRSGEVTFWKVQNVLWKANNVIQTEEEMIPFRPDMDSETVLLYVRSDSAETSEYLDRLHEQDKE